MPSLKPFDDSFFTDAPLRMEKTWEVNQPAAELWADLVERPLHWVKGLGVEWTTLKPYGPGTERTVSILGALKVQEHFFIWDEGRRQAFYATWISLPVFSRFGESFAIEPTGEGTCRFTWTIAAEASALGRPAGKLNLVPLKAAWADTTRHFAKLG